MYTIGGQPCLSQAYPAFRNFRPSNNMLGVRPIRQPQVSTVNLTAHRLPWRLFAFLSDLGLVGHLVRQPILAKLGLILSMPYYLFALASQPNGKARREELIYQSTANGIFPYVEAKAGVTLGKLLYKGLVATLPKKYSLALVKNVLPSMFESVGGFAALLVLTPTVGDRLSRSILEFYRKRRTLVQWC